MLLRIVFESLKGAYASRRTANYRAVALFKFLVSGGEVPQASDRIDCGEPAKIRNSEKPIWIFEHACHVLSWKTAVLSKVRKQLGQPLASGTQIAKDKFVIAMKIGKVSTIH